MGNKRICKSTHECIHWFQLQKHIINLSLHEKTKKIAYKIENTSTPKTYHHLSCYVLLGEAVDKKCTYITFLHRQKVM